jgi:hypothetical protein
MHFFFFMLPACSAIIKQAIKLFSVIFVFPVAIVQFLKISCSSMENISAWNISLVFWIQKLDKQNSSFWEYGEDIWTALKVRFNHTTQMRHFSSFFMNFCRFISHIDILVVHMSKHQIHLKVTFFFLQSRFFNDIYMHTILFKCSFGCECKFVIVKILSLL